MRAFVAILVAFPATLLAQDSVGRARYSALPVLGSAPETGAQYGATLVRTWRTGPVATTRPSQWQLYAIATARGQQRGFVQLDQWGTGNGSRTRVRAEFQRFPLPYFAEGGSDREASYRATGPELSALHLRRAGASSYRGVGVRLRDLRVSAVDLSRWTGAAPDLAGSLAATVQGIALVDTRDHLLGPSRGVVRQFTIGVTQARDRAPGHRGRTSARAAADLRRYAPLGGGVLAMRASGEGLVGDAPFDLLPQAGADTLLRGYTRGRIRDHFVGAMEAEYRTRTWRGLGAAAFAGVGASHALGRRVDAGASSHAFFPTVGGGVRYLLLPADHLSIRVDYGRGRHGGGLYVALGEAF